MAAIVPKSSEIESKNEISTHKMYNNNIFQLFWTIILLGTCIKFENQYDHFKISIEMKPLFSSFQNCFQIFSMCTQIEVIQF